MERYQCMTCKKIYTEGELPVIDKPNQRGDGCCSIGSLIEYSELKDLLTIRRKARRAGGHVAPGMRKHIYPQQIKEKKIYAIDVAHLSQHIQHGDINLSDAVRLMQ